MSEMWEGEEIMGKLNFKYGLFLGVLIAMNTLFFVFALVFCCDWEFSKQCF